MFQNYKSAEKNHAFWSISNHEKEVIDLLNKHPYSVGAMTHISRCVGGMGLRDSHVSSALMKCGEQ